MAAGEAKSDLWWLIGVVALLGLAWVATGGPSRLDLPVGPYLRPPAPLDSGQTYYLPGSGTAGSHYYDSNPPDSNSNRSPFFGQIKIYGGSAGSEITANNEYLTLTAAYSNTKPINITGWRLTNNGSHWLKGATIPGGTKLFVAGEVHPAQDPILLAPGESAIVTSGRMGATVPINIDTSFRSNLCTGYLGQLPDYRFVPGLWSNCPAPQSEPIVNSLDRDCYEVVKHLGACHTPNRTIGQDRDSTEYIDGVSLPGACRDFLLKEFNYNACVARHRRDANFFGSEWRVYLNQPDELWDKDREIITLYDEQGRIVDQLKY